MNTDDPCRHDAERFLAGEASPVEREAFLLHARMCESCSGLVELDTQFRGTPTGGQELTAVEGDRLRTAVIRELRLRVSRQAAPVSDIPVGSAFRRIRHGPAKAGPHIRGRGWRHARFVRAMPMAAAATLLLAAGFAAGRVWPSRADDTGEALARRIQRAALQDRTLADVENSPYMFTNVSFRRVDDARVALGFDVSTHVDLTAERSDPLVRELVVQAVLNPSPIGSRLNAIAYAEGLRDGDVMKALQIVMLNDPSVAVRLRALAALAAYKDDPGVQSAMLMVLRTAESVPMRLQAIDYLVEGRVDAQVMRDALQHLNPVDDAAALVKAGAYLQ